MQLLLISSQSMLFPAQLGYIPILLPPLHSSIHYIIRGLSRDRFGESPCISFPSTPHRSCSSGMSFSVSLFPVWTSNSIICPTCDMEIIPVRIKGWTVLAHVSYCSFSRPNYLHFFICWPFQYVLAQTCWHLFSFTNEYLSLKAVSIEHLMISFEVGC